MLLPTTMPPLSKAGKCIKQNDKSPHESVVYKVHQFILKDNITTSTILGIFRNMWGIFSAFFMTWHIQYLKARLLNTL